MLVSFDFDDTLLLTRPDEDWGSVEAGPNEPMMAALRAHAADGDTVIIVTSRSEKMEFKFQKTIGIAGLPEQFGPNIAPPRMPVSVFVATHSLPISEVRFTNGKDKAPMLEALGVTKHFDDDEEELALLPDHIEGVLAPIHPAWAQAIAAASIGNNDGD